MLRLLYNLQQSQIEVMDAFNVENLYRKASERLSMRGAFRARAGWTALQVRRKKLHKDWLPMLEKMEQILEEFYPGHWDIHTQITTDYANYKLPNGKLSRKPTRTTIFQPVVHFPDIILKNSQRKSQRLLDLFLRFNVEHRPDYGDNRFTFGHMYGMRATLSDLEYAAGYNHSHFQGQAKEFKFSRCCTGSGEVNKLFALLNHKFDDDDFRLLMLQLKTYASWESLEGHPYKKIENIFPKEKGVQSRLTQEDIEVYTEAILNHLQRNHVKLDWQLVAEVPKIVSNKNLDAALKYLGPELTAYDEEIVGLIQVMDESLRMAYYQAVLPDNSPKKKPRKVKGFIPFRGKEFPFAVLPPENTPGAKQKIYTQFFINSAIKQNVIGKLEKRAKRLADPVRNGVLRALKGEAAAPAALHAESKIPVW
jgi:hypothetical protein